MSNVKEIKIGNTTYDIVGKGVENQRDLSKAKVWVGTNAQYSSLGTLDSDTVYYRTDNGGTVETASTATSATNATNATNDGSGNNIASTYATKTELNQKSSFKLFHHDWFDYELNDMAWLRADTFSWQDGTVYSEAYDHLVDDYNNSQMTSYYAWTYNNNYTYYTLSETPSAYDQLYEYSNGAMVEADPLEELRAYDSTTIPPRIRVVNDGGGGSAYYDRNIEEDISVKTPNSETIGSYTIAYYLAPDGHKICLPDQETTAANIYNESGVAWYYVLDTANQRFKLPRTKYGFVGYRSGVGEYVPESLPDHMHYVSRSADIGNEDVTVEDGGSHDTVSRNSNLNTSYLAPTTYASYNNSAYQNDAPVQQRGTQMYLYFYVGQFTQTATEQTAGLNAGLFNGKVDLNAANLSTQGKSLISGFGMPSDRYINLTVGASGAEYVAPANGYYTISVTGSTNGRIYINRVINNNAIYGNFYTTKYGANDTTGMLPVKKNDVVKIGYDGTVNFLRFIYAEGEPNV